MTPVEQITDVQVIIPSKFAVAACTFRTDAVTSTVELAWIWTWPPAFIVIEQPLACRTWTCCAASSSTTLWPLCIDTVTFDAPSVSSNSRRLPDLDLMRRLSFEDAGDSGMDSRPFQLEPRT